MRVYRTVAVVVVASLLAIGFIIDRTDREHTFLPIPVLVSSPDASSGTWFCPGGSDMAGSAATGVEITNPGTTAVNARIELLRSDGEPPTTSEVLLEPASRTSVSLSSLVPDSAWVAAMVEVGDATVVVDQTSEGPAGTDRLPCATRTARRFGVPDGATRFIEFGEDLTLVLMNPFYEDAVVDIQFDADVGPDDLESVVVPARQVKAISVTDEVTVAERVSAVIDVEAGRIVVGRVQVRDGELVRGLTNTPAVADGSAVSVLTTVRRNDAQQDTVHVTNMSTEVTAEVDLEIVTDGSTSLDPIELTVRPGRTVSIDLSSETRLDGLESFAVIVRSLGGSPVAAMVESVVKLETEAVPGVAAAPALDAASTHWIAPLDNGGELSVINPSATSIAIVTVSVVTADGTVELFRSELGPRRRLALDAMEIETDRPILTVEASVPVVVGREIVGFTSRQLAGAATAGDVVPVDEVD